MNQQKHVFYYLTLSTVAVILLIVLAFYGSGDDIKTIDHDRILVVWLFVIISIFGISIAIRPRWYKKFTKTHNQKINNQNIKQTLIERKGHHPDCEQFNSHILTLKNKTYCTGCLGLAIGLTLAIFLAIGYIILVNEYQVTFYLLIFIGIFLIILTYFEIFIPNRKPIVHIVLNACLMIGFLLIIISMLEISSNILYSIISIIFSLLFLDTRIQLSNYNHKLICLKCNEKCKMYQ